MKEEQQNTMAIFFALAFGIMIGHNWPKIKNNLKPVLKAFEKQYGDITFESLGAMMGQKEIFDDMLAEWKVNKTVKGRNGKVKRKKGKTSAKKRAKKIARVASKTTV